MLIHEAAKISGLTKKAIAYYERQGLIAVHYNSNGYRDFEAEDIRTLKEISALRKLGLHVQDIKHVLTSGDKRRALRNCLLTKERQLRLDQARLGVLRDLLERHPDDLGEALEEIEGKLDGMLPVKEKLLQAFPGKFGEYLYVHFEKYLGEPLDSPQKIEAYHRIIDFLDRTGELELSEEAELILSDSFEALSRADFKKIHEDIENALLDVPEYLSTRRDSISAWLEYRESAAFKAGPGYRLQQSLREFQSRSGYHDIFIPNLKILSGSYREYHRKLEAANAYFLAEFNGKIPPE